MYKYMKSKTTLLVQEYLRSPQFLGTGLKSLSEAPYFLNVKQHQTFTSLYQFSYDQIDSPKSDLLVKECRGLILDSADNWNVVAIAFDRFFNAGESCAAEIDWKTARVQEKVDGSLILMYWYADRWQIATKGSPDASGPISSYETTDKGVTVPLTFSRLFWSSCEYWLKGLSKSGEFNKDCTYIWELTSFYNRVVCDYSKTGLTQYVTEDGEIFEVPEDTTGYSGDGSRITLIGIRNNKTLEEYPVSQYTDDVHYVVKEFPLQTFEDVVHAASNLNPLTQEGYVVVDKNFNRIKIKSPAYVELHHLRDGSPEKRIMNIIKTGEGTEVMSYSLLDSFPQEKAIFENYTIKINEIVLTAENLYNTIKHEINQKDFAMVAKNSPVSGALFMVRAGKCKSIREGIFGMATEKLLELMK